MPTELSILTSAKEDVRQAEKLAKNIVKSNNVIGIRPSEAAIDAVRAARAIGESGLLAAHRAALAELQPVFNARLTVESMSNFAVALPKYDLASVMPRVGLGDWGLTFPNTISTFAESLIQQQESFAGNRLKEIGLAFANVTSGWSAVGDYFNDVQQIYRQIQEVERQDREDCAALGIDRDNVPDFYNQMDVVQFAAEAQNARGIRSWMDNGATPNDLSDPHFRHYEAITTEIRKGRLSLHTLSRLQQEYKDKPQQWLNSKRGQPREACYDHAFNCCIKGMSQKQAFDQMIEIEHVEILSAEDYLCRFTAFKQAMKRRSKWYRLQ